MAATAPAITEKQPTPPQVTSTLGDSVQSVLQSPGEQLPWEVRGEMQGRFGRDFSSVRIHTDRDAQRSADSLNAAAYSYGNHVVFHRPSLIQNRSLVAHELTHVAQTQGHADPAEARLNESPGREGEARLNSERLATSDGPLTALQTGPAGIQRTPKGKEKEEEKDEGSILDRLKGVLDELGIGLWDAVSLWKNRDQFVANFMKGVGSGFDNFQKNIRKHLKTGLMSWLLGSMQKSGVSVPTEFTPQSVFRFAMEVMGLTRDVLLAKLAKVVGEKRVEQIAKVVDVATAFMSTDIGDLWEHLKGQLASIKNTLVEGIREFVIEKIVTQGIKRLLMWLNPAGAVLAAVKGIYKLYTFLRDNIARFKSLFNTIVGGIKSVIEGKIGGIAASVEGTLGQGVSLAIDLFARLLGLGDIGKKVRELVDKIRNPIHKAVDALIAKVANLFASRRSKGRKGKRKSKKDDPPKHSPEKQKKINEGLAEFRRIEKPFLDQEGEIEGHEAADAAKQVHKKHKVFSSFTVRRDGQDWVYEYAASPKKEAARTPDDKDAKGSEANREGPWAWGNSDSMLFHRPRSRFYKNVNDLAPESRPSKWIALTSEAAASKSGFSPARGSEVGGKGRIVYAQSMPSVAKKGDVDTVNPGGQRAKVIGIVGKPVPRSNFENVLQRISGFHRAHLFGAGLGDETKHGIMYTPPTDNQRIHGWIEGRIRRLQRRFRQKGVIQLTASVTSHKPKDVDEAYPHRDRFAQSYKFSIAIYRPGKTPPSITTPLSAKPDHVETTTVSIPRPPSKGKLRATRKEENKRRKKLTSEIVKQNLNPETNERFEEQLEP